jgi:hypothetical protein
MLYYSALERYWLSILWHDLACQIFEIPCTCENCARILWKACVTGKILSYVACTINKTE